MAILLASCSQLGCMIITDSGSEHSLRFGSDSWAKDNATYAFAKADDKLPSSVYFAELERSWSKERFNPSTGEQATEDYIGTSYNTRDDSISYNDNDYSQPMTGLAEAEEMPIAHSILTHMFGTKGYTGPRYVRHEVTERFARIANLSFNKHSNGYVSTARIHRTKKVMGPSYSFVILSRDK